MYRTVSYTSKESVLCGKNINLFPIKIQCIQTNTHTHMWTQAIENQSDCNLLFSLFYNKQTQAVQPTVFGSLGKLLSFTCILKSIWIKYNFLWAILKMYDISRSRWNLETASHRWDELCYHTHPSPSLCQAETISLLSRLYLWTCCGWWLRNHLPSWWSHVRHSTFCHLLEIQTLSFLLCDKKRLHIDLKQEHLSVTIWRSVRFIL